MNIIKHILCVSFLLMGLNALGMDKKEDNCVDQISIKTKAEKAAHWALAVTNINNYSLLCKERMGTKPQRTHLK